MYWNHVLVAGHNRANWNIKMNDFTMNSKLAALLLGASLISLPAYGQTPSSEHVNGFVEILEQNQCTLSLEKLEEAFHERFPDTFFFIYEVAIQAGQDGKLGINEETGIVTLYTDSCGNADDAPLPKFIDVMAENGCSMTESNAEVILPGLGFTRAEIGFLVKLLTETDRADVDVDTFTVFPPTCVPK